MNFRNVLIFLVTAPAWKVFTLFMLPVFLFIVAPFDFSGAFLIFATLTVFLWIYSAGVLLHRKYSQYLSISLNGFKICLLYCSLNSVLGMSGIIPFDYLIPFQLLSVGCNIYSLYFVSRLIVLIEKKSAVKLRDYIGTFVGAWFFYIGIWYIQPRVTRLFLSDEL